MEFNLKQFLKQNWIIILLWFLSTSFYLAQKIITRISWDFSVYWLNGLHYIGQGTYFELARPPLVSLVMSLFSIFGDFGQYIFIIFTSSLFALSSVKFAKACKFNPSLFYLFSLVPFTLLHGLFDGTELFSLALLELFIISLIKFKNSGHWIGLAGLARYTNLSLAALLVFSKNLKQFIINCFLFGFTLLPWFLYNRIFYGNYFRSIAESLALNVKFRKEYIIPRYDFLYMGKVMNILLVFLGIGLVFALYKLFKYFKKNPKEKLLNIWKKESITRTDIIIIIFTLITINGFLDVPLKDPRYLFNLILPSAYFFMRFLSAFKKENFKKSLITFSILLMILFQAFFLRAYVGEIENHRAENNPALYHEAIDRLNELELQNCKIMTDQWTLMNYFGQRAEPIPPREAFDYFLDKGYAYVIFYSFPKFAKENSDGPEFRLKDEYFVLEKNLDHKNLLYFSSRYVIYGNSSLCPTELEEKSFDNLYFDQVNRNYWLRDRKNISYDTCNVLFHEDSSLDKFCNFVNFKFE
jgi:hypothetical protein